MTQCVSVSAFQVYHGATPWKSLYAVHQLEFRFHEDSESCSCAEGLTLSQLTVARMMHGY